MKERIVTPSSPQSDGMAEPGTATAAKPVTLIEQRDALRAQRYALATVCKEMIDALEDRYDGAPDSDTLWMGGHIRDLRAALALIPTAEGGETQSRWISVADAMPENERRVLVLSPRWDGWRIGMYVEVVAEWRIEGSNSAWNVTDWFDVPEKSAAAPVSEPVRAEPDAEGDGDRGHDGALA